MLSFYQGMLKKVSRQLFRHITGTPSVGTTVKRQELVLTSEPMLQTKKSFNTKITISELLLPLFLNKFYVQNLFHTNESTGK